MQKSSNSHFIVNNLNSKLIYGYGILLYFCIINMLFVSCTKTKFMEKTVDKNSLFHREEIEVKDLPHILPSNQIDNPVDKKEFSEDVPIDNLSFDHDEVIDGLKSSGIHVTGMVEGSSVSLHKGDCNQHEDDRIYSDGTLIPKEANQNIEQKLYVRYEIGQKYNCKELTGSYVFLIPPTISLNEEQTDLDRRIPHFNVGDLFQGKEVTVSLHSDSDCSSNSLSDLVQTSNGSTVVSLKTPLRDPKFKDYYAKQSYKGVSNCSQVLEYAKGRYPEFYMFNHERDYARSIYMNQNRGIIVKNTTLNHTLKIYKGISCDREDKLLTSITTLGDTTLVETPSLEDGNYIFSFLELDSNGNRLGCYKTPELAMKTKKYISNEYGTVKINDSKKSIQTSKLIQQTQNLGKTIKHIYSTKKAFAILFTDGSVKVAGDSNFGGSANNYLSDLNGEIPVVAIYQTESAFAALRSNGSVVTWGSGVDGGSSSAVSGSLSGGVKTVFATSKAFAALKSNGSVITWGNESYGGNSSSVSGELSSGVISIFSTLNTFVALKEDGSLVSWGGDVWYNSYSHSAKSLISSQQGVLGIKPDGTLQTGYALWFKAPYDTHHISSIHTTEEAYSALFENGSVVTWGGVNDKNGGDSSSVASLLDGNIPVVEIYSTKVAFAALRADGSLVIWGSNKLDEAKTETYLVSGDIPVVDVYTSCGAFLILRKDGSVISWGDPGYGGNISSDIPALTDGLEIASVQVHSTGFYVLLSDGTEINSDKKKYIPENKAIVQISYNYSSVAVLLNDGSVVTWGEESSGGDSSQVASKLDGTIRVVGIYPRNDTNISVSSQYMRGAFVALREDGSVVTWGDAGYGGDSSGVASKLDGTVKVTSIVASRSVTSEGMAFAALREDGSVVTWGNPSYGGDSSEVLSRISSGVKEVFATGSAFAALKNDGSVVSWGNTSNWDSNSGAALDSLQSGVKTIYSNIGAFAAVKNNGAVVVWGIGTSGGVMSDVISEQLNGSIPVKSISSTYRSGSVNNPFGAFAALREDGSAVSWGNMGNASFFPNGTSLSSSVKAVYSNNNAFVALKTDGKLVPWGIRGKGGTLTSNNLTSGGGGISIESFVSEVTDKIIGSQSSFAAIQTNGSVICWGMGESGGNYSVIQNVLDGSISAVSLYSTSRAFAALRENGSVVTWGHASYGGDSSKLAASINGTIPVVKIFPADRFGFFATRSDGTNVYWSDNKVFLF